jgi:hypothetical protein
VQVQTVVNIFVNSYIVVKYNDALSNVEIVISDRRIITELGNT